MITGKRRRNAKAQDYNSSTSGSSKISADGLYLTLEQMKGDHVRGSTKLNYHGIWTNFNKFVIQLDHIPSTWEEKTCLYCVALFKQGYQSATVRSYVSAIKYKLVTDNYEWNDNLVLLSTLTKSFQLNNDEVLTRLPVGVILLELLIFELIRSGEHGRYDTLLYKTIFLTMFYGMLRIGEAVKGKLHTVKAVNVHISQNKTNVLLVLYSSKTHGKRDRPQKIRIDNKNRKEGTVFNPVEELIQYSNTRPGYRYDLEPYFVFENGQSVKDIHVRAILKRLLRKLGLEDEFYGTHSLRIGRATDLFKQGVPVENIKQMGRWKSNAVYKYLRQF